MRLLDLFGRRGPEIGIAGSRDAAKLAKVHAASFRRGWSEQEFEHLLLDRNVVAHRATSGRHLDGFIISRLAVDEAEILSVAVAASQRGRGLAGRLLDLHLRTLAGRGVRAVFLEVEEANRAATRLYARRGFREVGRRDAYYGGAGAGSRALVLRRDLV
jgi:[ribosomal protein S18]-alanine N-acetyltransferase